MVKSEGQRSRCRAQREIDNQTLKPYALCLTRVWEPSISSTRRQVEYTSFRCAFFTSISFLYFPVSSSLCHLLSLLYRSTRRFLFLLSRYECFNVVLHSVRPHGWIPVRSAAIVRQFVFFSHLTPLPFRRTDRWSQGINPSLPGTRLANFDLADWVSTPAPRQITTNKLS